MIQLHCDSCRSVSGQFLSLCTRMTVAQLALPGHISAGCWHESGQLLLLFTHLSSCQNRLVHDSNLNDAITWCEQLHRSNSLDQLGIKSKNVVVTRVPITVPLVQDSNSYNAVTWCEQLHCSNLRGQLGRQLALCNHSKILSCGMVY